MNKRLLSGLVALSLVAGMSAMTANAVKLGDVNQDTRIDIEDAVAVIGHVNGVKALTKDEEKIADVDKSNKIDIEDAVRIINHINGVTPIADEDVATDEETTTSEDSSKPDSSAPDSSKPDSSKPDSSLPDSSAPDSSEPDSSEPDSSLPDSSAPDSSEPDDSALKDGEYWITIHNDAPDAEDGLPVAISCKSGVFFNEDKTVYFPKTSLPEKVISGGGSLSFGFRADSRKYDNTGSIKINDALDPTGTTTLFDLNDLMNHSDAEHNINLYYYNGDWSFTPHEIKVYDEGERTEEMFEQLADGNYYFAFTGNGVVLDVVTSMDVTIKQITNDTSRAHVIMPGRHLDADIVITPNESGSLIKRKIVDEENKIYTATLSYSEKQMNFNAIFSSIANNKDDMKFIEQTEDEENGLIVEHYTAKITKPVEADVIIKASFDKKTNELKKLVMYTEDYIDDDPDSTTVYLETDTIDFKPSYEAEEGTIPDFADGWTKK